MAKQSYTLIDGAWVPTGGPPGVESTTPGPSGAPGPAGPGVPTGGATGQILAKNSATDYDAEWSDPPPDASSTIVAPEPPDPTGLPEGTWWVDEDSAVDVGGGSTILSGTAAPTVGTGNVGDYYLDTDDRVLYGPKVMVPATGPLQYAYTTQVPTETVSVGSGSFGNDFVFAVAGVLVGLRYYRAATATTAAKTMRAWALGGGELGNCATSGESGAGWKSAMFVTPIPITAGQTVRAQFDVLTNDPIARWPTPGANTVNGDVTLIRGGLTGFPPGSYMTGTSSSTYFMDVIFQATAGTVGYWPVALKSVPPGGTTSQVLAKTDATDYAADWATAAAAGPTIPSGTANKDMLRWQLGASTKTITYSTDGTNGLIDWCRTSSFVITPTQSSLLAAGYEADKAIDGNLTNYMHTGNFTSSWLKFDFGTSRKVLPTSASLFGRNFASSLPRLYNIQGSNDDSAWTNLYSTGATPNQVPQNAWKNLPTTGSTAYRYIRILQTGTESSGSEYLTLGEIELYGDLVPNTIVPSVWVAEADAPADSKQYARKDGAWAEVAASTFLTGTAAPTTGTGAVGGYYLDTDDHILYGPKAGDNTWPVALYGNKNIIVLGPAAPVPGGTPAGTIIVRTAT